MTFVSMVMNKKVIKITGAIFALLLFLLFVGVYCPIQNIFGIPCPGCNMTTSLYYLLTGHLQASLFYHAMLIPTFVFGLLFLYCQIKKKKKWKERILWMWAGCMIVYYIYRMLFIFPDIPMVYDTNSLLGQLLHITL